ncbi:MAG: hypothetical protein KF819_16935 [Labilithrix sp.]|nr:hypothetical protein [Labilithrix sp.]
MRRLAIAALALAGVASTCAIASLRDAGAQRLDPRRPSVFIVGAPGGASPTLRGDARRTGAARDLLPSGVIRISWRKTIGISVEQPALAGPDGTLAVVGTARGEVVFIDENGDERGHVNAGTAGAALATMTSDGTVVFMTKAGDAVGVRRTLTRPRFVTRVGGEANVRVAPLSLDDGGVVVATMTDLVVLDSEGNVRARASLPESPAQPLLVSGDKVVAISTTGAVFGWTPGREPVRVGSFGAPTDGGAALADATTLLAVIEGNHLVELDLARGARSTRAIAAQGLYLGPPAVRSGGAATLIAMTQSRELVVTIAPSGQETMAPVGSFTKPPLPDGGVPPLVAPLHTQTAPIVDPRGAVAFVTPTDGRVGIISADGALDAVGELICTRSGASNGVAGLTPFGKGAFAVTCNNGVVARISGPEADSLRRPSAKPARPSSPTPPPAPPPPPDDDDDEEP